MSDSRDTTSRFQKFGVCQPRAGPRPTSLLVGICILATSASLAGCKPATLAVPETGNLCGNSEAIGIYADGDAGPRNDLIGLRVRVARELNGYLVLESRDGRLCAAPGLGGPVAGADASLPECTSSVELPVQSSNAAFVVLYLPISRASAHYLAATLVDTARVPRGSALCVVPVATSDASDVQDATEEDR